MRSSSKFLLLAVLSLFTLSACETITPQPMGRGYSSYDKPYKSVDGSKSMGVGYNYSEDKNIAVMDDIQKAARSLVMGLGKELSYSAEPLYLEMPESQSAFLAAFDHALRGELTAQGYSMTMDKTKALPVTFIAQKPDAEIIKNLPEGYETLFLALGMNFVKDKPQTVIGGFYDVPAYDFSAAGPNVDQLVYSGEKQKPCMKGKSCSKCKKDASKCQKCSKKSKCTKCAQKKKDKPCTICEQSEKDFQKQKQHETCKSCKTGKKCSTCAKDSDTEVKKICNRLCSKDCDNSCKGQCDKPCGK